MEQVKDKIHWDLQVANQSINRKGDLRLSPENGYWTIWLRKGGEFTANASHVLNLHVREMHQKVGVCVDYEDGEVSFYDVDGRACIFLPALTSQRSSFRSSAPVLMTTAKIQPP